jgi:macrolide transport system ATP-binding/permease protein
MGGPAKGAEGEVTTVNALQGVNLTIESGEFVAIIGPSGSGKSTLLHLLGLLDRPESGSYKLMGREVAHLSDTEWAALRNAHIGFVFQQFHLLSRMSALDNVMLPLIYSGQRRLKAAAVEGIERVRMGHRMGHRPNQMSGGEQQRIAVARALVNHPSLILADEPTGNLDSRNAKEIIELLETLNRAGKTVIMVTHERELAEHASRIISIRDGAIVGDERLRVPGAKLAGAVPERRTVAVHAGRAGFLDHFGQALRAMVSHKMRAALSMLGILIGVAAVIAMLAVAQGAQEQIQKSISSLGSNLLSITPGARKLYGVALEAGIVTRFTLEDAGAIGGLPEMKRSSPTVRGRGQLVWGNKNWSVSIIGCGPDYDQMHAGTPYAGRFLTDAEVSGREKVVVLGPVVVREVFGDVSPIGKTVKINRINFRVIGVLPSKGGGWFGWDETALVPVTTAMYRLLGQSYLGSMEVEVKDASLIEKSKTSIRELMARRRGLPVHEDASVDIRDMTDFKQAISDTGKTMGFLLGSIALISLIVGGIGIMNIMLVSVTERTREIGLRKAIGASRGDIMRQFLVEAVVMTVTGGVLGILLGWGAAAALAASQNWPFRIAPVVVVMAFVFSATVGLIFGLWPARKASMLDPIEALRYE